MTEKKYLRTIRNEPPWPTMFKYAEQIVRTNVAKDQGREFVLEMLEFGGRCYENLKTGGAE